MNYFTWETGFALGEPEHDQQHYALLDLVNQFHRAVEAKSREDAAEVLEQLIERLETHFAREERLLNRVGYVHLNAHRRAHQGFLQRLVRHQLEFSLGKHIAPQLLAELRMGLLNHMLFPPLRQALTTPEASGMTWSATQPSAVAAGALHHH